MTSELFQHQCQYLHFLSCNISSCTDDNTDKYSDSLEIVQIEIIQIDLYKKSLFCLIDIYDWNSTVTVERVEETLAQISWNEPKVPFLYFMVMLSQEDSLLPQVAFVNRYTMFCYQG